MISSPVGLLREAKRWVRRRGGLVGSFSATTAAGVVVLTFDDGPDPDQTPRILDHLAAHDATATFFVLLTRVRRHPELLRAIVEAGHEVALHGPDHRALSAYTHREALSRTRDARRELESLSGTVVRWYRPPYGSQTPSSWLAVRRAGLFPVLWSGTTWDWKDVTQDQRRAKSLEAGRSGAILLAHDGIAGVDDGVEDSPGALADRAGLVGWLLEEYAARGLRAVSLAEALRTGAGVRTLEFTSLRRRGRSPHSRMSE